MQITAIRDRLEQLEALDKRREAIVKSLEERKLMTETLAAKIAAAEKAPSHRILAIRRGEAEGFLFSRLVPDEIEALSLLERMFVKSPGGTRSVVSPSNSTTSPAVETSGARQSVPLQCSDHVRLAVQDCFKRLLGFAMEGEARTFFKKRAKISTDRYVTADVGVPTL